MGGGIKMGWFSFKECPVPEAHAMTHALLDQSPFGSKAFSQSH